MMKAAISSGKELIESMEQAGRYQISKHGREFLIKGVMVSAAIRKEILTSESQGKITINGTVSQINFENLGGGVYRAYVGKLEAES